MTANGKPIIGAKRILGYGLFSMGVTILFALGCWQFVRGLEKSHIEQKQADGREVRAVRAAPEDWKALDYQRVQLEGSWLPQKSFLLDNRLNQGKAGYEVLAPFVLESDDSLLLVNRGWLEKPGPSDADKQVVVNPPRHSDQVVGELYRPQKGFTLGETWTGEVRWPLTILYQDLPALSRALGRTIEPASLVLSADSPHSFERIWQPVSMPPSRHFGYAVQWWGLTLTLIIFGAIWRRRS